MRVWVDPDQLAARNLTATDVVAAIREQNIQVAAGQIGQPPLQRQAGSTSSRSPPSAGSSTPEQFENIIIRTTPDGRIIRIKDVGRVELGAKNQDVANKLDGHPSTGLAIFQLPDANALATADRIHAKMEELKSDVPARTSTTRSAYDTTPFIRESINEVFKTLLDAIILVAIVVLLFLQNWRSALIPLIAVPVAIIGTFAVMAAMGFSLNNLTLFGLVLAIGIVVDDAIVVVEAVEHHIEQGMAPREATIKAMERGVRAGDRRRPGAVGGVRAVRVHQRHHRPVLPPVRADDRRLDHHLGVQFADAEPGPGGPLAQAGKDGASRDLVGRRACDFVAGLVLPAVQLRASGRATNAYTPRSSAWPAARAASWCCCVYAGLLGLTLLGLQPACRRGFIPTQDMGYLLRQRPDCPTPPPLERTTGGREPRSTKIAADDDAAASGQHAIAIVGPVVRRSAPPARTSADVRHPRSPSPSGADSGPVQHAPSPTGWPSRSREEIPDAKVAVFGPPPVRGVGSGRRLQVHGRGPRRPRPRDALQERRPTTSSPRANKDAAAQAG